MALNPFSRVSFSDASRKKTSVKLQWNKVMQRRFRKENAQIVVQTLLNKHQRALSLASSSNTVQDTDVNSIFSVNKVGTHCIEERSPPGEVYGGRRAFAEMNALRSSWSKSLT